MTKSKRIMSSGGTSARNPDAPEDYLARGWFPVNGTKLRAIKEKVDTGGYTGNGKQFVDDLKGDYALLTFCLKALKGGHTENQSPFSRLESLSPDEMKQILSVTEGDISHHSFSDMLKVQALRFKHSVISCSTAEAIAEKTGFDPEWVYSCALFRQVGLHLVAWNYPRIYQKALSSMLTGAGELEAILTKNLNFSPRNLGIKLTLGNISPGLRVGLGLDQGGQDNEAAHAAKLCEIGEAFAKVNDPEHFPGDTRNWKTVVQNINHYLGPKGISIIRERMEANCANYVALAPKIFETDLSPEKNLEIANQNFAQTLMATNVHVGKVPEDLREGLLRVYKQMRPGTISTEALQIMVNELVPSAGFTRGCVFLLDMNMQALVPRLRIGDRTINNYKPFILSSAEGTDNPILDALYSAIPIKQENALLFGEKVSHVSGSIGSGDKTGVLYLEMGSKLADAGGLEAVLRFKAIRQCLNDCLNLGQT